MVRNGVTLLDRLQRFDLFAIDGLHLEGSLCNSANFCTLSRLRFLTYLKEH